MQSLASTRTSHVEREARVRRTRVRSVHDVRREARREERAERLGTRYYTAGLHRSLGALPPFAAALL